MKPDFHMRDVEIYLDNAATTALDPEVVEAMRPYWDERYGNPETVYRLGREAQEAVENSRAAIAELLKCDPEEVYFTSGGTESNNWAIKGVPEPRGVIVSAVEHASVLEPANWVSRDLPLLKIPVDEYGVIDLVELESALKSGNYGLVSIQYANNEIGTVQPVAEIAELCRRYSAVFHCDAVQAFGKIDFDVADVGCDMMSLSAHKIHGPMGMGALYVKKGTEIVPLLHGGGQEREMRSGTLAVPEIVGFAKAAELAHVAIPNEMPRLKNIAEWLAGQLCISFKAKRNGHPTKRLPNIVSVTLPNMETEVMCGIMCSKYGTCISAGAACSTSKRVSHVLGAIGRNPRDVLSTLRFSLSRYNSDSDIRLAYVRLQSAYEEAKTRALI
jgi:cysteine desulfurase